MTFWSILMVKVKNGNGEAAAQAWVKRRCVEEAAETIPGFRHGEVLLSPSEPDLMCVMCAWDDEAAYQAWQKSPVRAKQVTDLSPLFSGDVKTMIFQSIHAVPKP